MFAEIVAPWLAVCASTAAWAYTRSRKRVRTADAAEPVLLLRPCAGNEPHLSQALASSRAAPPGSYVRFLVASPSDSATPVALRACAELAAEKLDARVVVTEVLAANRKAGQLDVGVATGPLSPAIIVVADSDVALTRAVVADLLAPLVKGEAAATWAPPIETTPRTLADATSAAVLGASLHAFALLSALDPRGMVGKVFAIRRDALERVGAFRTLETFLGEDMELARRLQLASLRSAVTASPAASLAMGRSWAAVMNRYARWLAVIRAQRPILLLAYPLLIAAAPIQLGLAVAGVLAREAHAIVLTIFVVGARTCVAALARRRSRAGAADVFVTPWLADVTLLVALGRALLTRTVLWRGVRLRVARGAALAEVER